MSLSRATRTSAVPGRSPATAWRAPTAVSATSPTSLSMTPTVLTQPLEEHPELGVVAVGEEVVVIVAGQGDELLGLVGGGEEALAEGDGDGGGGVAGGVHPLPAVGGGVGP